MSFVEQTRVDVVDEPEWDDAAVSVGEEALAPADDEDAEPASTLALFDGDEGGLELDERRALVVLLKNRFITSESHPKEWKTVVASRQAITRRLNDLFLELKFDPKREVAYKRPVSSDTGGRDFPTLVHDTIWQREETALLVYLRVRARNEEARGETQVRVSQSEMLEFLRENRPDSATNHVADGRRADRAITALKSAGLLVRTEEDNVYRISPAIEPMLPMPILTSLLSWIKIRMESGSVPASGPDNDDDRTEEDRS